MGPLRALHVGGSARLQAVADHPLVRERAPALAEAARQVGTPALRAMGTLAGNLCQAPRCWYWRGGIPCRRTDAALPCHALEGESEHHAIFEVEPCAVVHPSDPAVALLALDAVVLTAGMDGALRELPLAELHAHPTAQPSTAPLRDTTLAAGELVAGVQLPAHTAGTRQRYVKLMQRAAWDFALASCAAVATTDGRLRIALGGVAARPWLVPPELLADLRIGERRFPGAGRRGGRPPAGLGDPPARQPLQAGSRSAPDHRRHRLSHGPLIAGNPRHSSTVSLSIAYSRHIFSGMHDVIGSLGGFRGVRAELLVTLKKEQPLTASELAARFGLTPNALRRHLKVLEEDGVVRYQREVRGVGAPVFAYRLTEAGEAMFPRRYASVLASALEALQAERGGRVGGPGARAREWDALAADAGPVLDGLPLPERVQLVAELLTARGYMAEGAGQRTERRGDTAHSQLCDVRNRRAVPRGVRGGGAAVGATPGRPVKRRAHRFDGAALCAYRDRRRRTAAGLHPHIDDPSDGRRDCVVPRNGSIAWHEEQA